MQNIIFGITNFQRMECSFMNIPKPLKNVRRISTNGSLLTKKQELHSCATRTIWDSVFIALWAYSGSIRKSQYKRINAYGNAFRIFINIKHTNKGNIAFVCYAILHWLWKMLKQKHPPLILFEGAGVFMCSRYFSQWILIRYCLCRWGSRIHFRLTVIVICHCRA